jgi:peptide/nickel transport system permease protein
VLRFVIRRLIGAVLVLFIVITATFVISHKLPADPARAAAGVQAGAQQVAATRHEIGLDRPILAQYWTYLSGIVHGDLGTSYATRQPIAPQLGDALPATIELVLISFVVYLVAGVGAGVLWARFRGGVIGGLLRAGTGLFLAMPVFWLAIVLQLWIGSRLGWLPINGRFDFNATPPTRITGLYTLDALFTGNFAALGDALRHLVLPVLTMVVWMFALAARLTQKSMVTELGRPYVRTALAKGAGPQRILFRHVFRNAINPVVTVLGMQFGWLLGGTVLVEVVFSWPGIGGYMYTALRTFDYPAITAVTIAITMGFVLVNLLVDLLYPLLDPRIRRA